MCLNNNNINNNNDDDDDDDHNNNSTLFVEQFPSLPSSANLKTFTVPYFSVRSLMLIVEFDGPPSWSHDASENGEYKMPVGRGGEVNSVWVVSLAVHSTAHSTIPAHGHLMAACRT